MWWPSKASLGSCCEQKESQVQVSQHVDRRQVQVSQQEDVVRREVCEKSNTSCALHGDHSLHSLPPKEHGSWHGLHAEG